MNFYNGRKTSCFSMKRTIIDDKFRDSWRSYILQTVFAFIAIFIVFLFLNIQQIVIIASIGSTVFIIFAMPKSITARPRNVIGGHAIGLFSGLVSTLIPYYSPLSSIVVYSLAITLSIFLMVVTNTEHPPASGTALGVALTGFSVDATIAVIVSSALLSLIHHFSKSYLKDLT
jgi:CBS-domain-containing membrane protein